MKNIGFIRRIDNLGRIVIPKEIRETLGIRECSPLEIVASKEGGVTFVPYRTSLAEEVRTFKDRIVTELDYTGCPTKEDQIVVYLESAADLIEKLENDKD